MNATANVAFTGDDVEVIQPESVPSGMAEATPTSLSPADFERFAASLFSQAARTVENLRVTVQERVKGSDGAYVIDATVRYRFADMDFLVLVEAKLHHHPIKRDVVQVLHGKVDSLGAHKGVLVATAPFQAGAMEYARVHGIALVHVTDEPRWVLRHTTVSDRFNRLPHQPVARCWARSDTGTLESTLVSEEPAYAAKLLLGVITTDG